MGKGYSTVDATIAAFTALSGVAIAVAELDFSVKVTAAIAWLLTMAWGAIAMKISGSINKLKSEILEVHIMEMKADIAMIKESLRIDHESSLRHGHSDSNIIRP